MFILAVRKDRLEWPHDGWSAADVPFAGRKVFLIYDAARAACVTSADEFVLCQKAADDSGRPDPRIPLLNVRMNHSDGRLRIRRESLFSGQIYYFNDGQDFVLTSDLRLMRAAGIALKENPEALTEQLIFKYVFPPRTLFQNIRRMFREEEIDLLVSPEGLSGVQYHLPCAPGRSVPVSKDKAVAQIRDILTDTLENFRTHRSRIALFLSGGLDSTVLCRLTQSVIGDVKTYSVSYPVVDGRGEREKEYAQSAARWLKTDHTHYIPTLQEYLLGLVDAVQEAQAPLQMLQSVLIHLLGKNAVGKENVILTGQGFDTIFGSDSETRMLFQQGVSYRFLRSEPFFHLVKWTSRLFQREYLYERLSQPLMLNDDERANPRHVLWQVDYQGNGEWVADHFSKNVWAEAWAGRQALAQRLTGCSIFEQLFYYSWFGESAHTQNEWADMSWRRGRAFYCPVKSRAMREYSLSLPPELKYKERKHLARELAKEIGVPPEFIHRPKSSMGLWPDVWAVKGGIFDVYRTLCLDHFEQKDIEEQQSPQKARAFTFWNMINYSIWKKLFIEGISPETIKDRIRHEMERSSAVVR